MANFIVTCQKIGQALTNWIVNIGTPSDKLKLCEAIRDDLGCGFLTEDNFNLSTEDTKSVDLIGTGNIANPLSAEVKVSSNVGNLIRVEETSNEGLYAGLEIQDTNSVKLAGRGSIDSPLTADARISTLAGNLIRVEESSNEGLHASLVVQDTSSIKFYGDGNADSPLTADAKISILAGNLIRVEEDGLYAGETAPADVSTLYVSSSEGNDANQGLRNSPLATLGEAIRRQNMNPGSYTIYLKCGDVFEIGAAFPRINGPSTRIGYYGDPIYGDQANTSTSCYYYQPWRGIQLTRPIIVVSAKVLSHIVPPSYTLTSLFSAGSIYLTGIEIRLNAPPPPGHVLIDESLVGATNRISVEGCIVSYFAGDPAMAFFSPQVLFDQSAYRLPAGSKLLFTLTLSTALEVTGILGTPDGCGLNPAYTPLIGSSAQAQAQFNLFNLASPISYDAATKSLFGISVNWDIFATTEAMTA